MKLKALLRLSGGRDLAVQTIEKHYVAGCDHLVDKMLINKYDEMGACCAICSSLVLIGAVVVLLYFSILNFKNLDMNR